MQKPDKGGDKWCLWSQHQRRVPLLFLKVVPTADTRSQEITKEIVQKIYNPSFQVKPYQQLEKKRKKNVYSGSTGTQLEGRFKTALIKMVLVKRARARAHARARAFFCVNMPLERRDESQESRLPKAARISTAKVSH